MAADPEPLALYIHWPFCLSKCPYCDFNSHVREGVDVAEWQAALLAEMAHYAALTGRRKITSIFFGGGTPSLMPASLVSALVEGAADLWGFDEDIEITLEANPTSAEAALFGDLGRAGVNRLSVGVQALEDEALVFLGREHAVSEALNAVEAAQKSVARVSFDLIYARPGQTVTGWEDELRQALAIGTDHLSLYQLTIERGTQFFARHRGGEFILPDDETGAEMFERTQAICEEAGLPAYEISNHAQVGQACRHNLTYWTGGDYAGIGPGAHGRLTVNGQTRATEQITGPENWLAAAQKDGHGTRVDDPVPPASRIEEMIMTGLRLRDGIDRTTFEACAGCELELVFEPRRLRTLLSGGFLTIDEDGLRTTAEGRIRLNAVLASLLS